MTSGEVTSSSVSRPTTRGRRRWPLWVLVFLALVVLVRGVFFETFTVPSGSMEPTLRPGDRIVVWKLGEDSLHRGDIIVFNGTDAFGLNTGEDSPNALVSAVRSAGDALGFRTGEADYVKRVIALPGQTVSVDHRGTLRVDGSVVHEPYLAAGMQASRVPFRVTVPPGRVFVMGDNRPASQDSRSHLGSPGGGTVPVEDVIGTVVLRYWPLASWGRLDS